MKKIIEKHLGEVIQKEYGIDVGDLQVTIPPKSTMGDLSFGTFILAKYLKKSPREIAQDLKQILEKTQYHISHIRCVDVVDGYLNIFLDSSAYASALDTFIHSDIYAPLRGDSSQVIYIDYIGANVGKPLHIGHMCTPLQGQVLVNAFQKLDYKVISDSHIGDWGIIFGKLIVGFKKYGDEEKLQQNAVEHLFKIYVQITADAEAIPTLDQEFRDTFKKLSSGDVHLISIWEKFTKQSIAAMNLLLSRLHVFPDYNIGESFYEGLGLPKMEDYPELVYPMHDIVQELIDKKIATRNDDGSVGVVFPDETKIPSCILRKRDGTHGYLASDLASVKYRMDNWQAKKILYFVDVRQQLHLKQTFEISKMAGWINQETEITHAHNGFISLKDGAMSTRKGKIIKLEDVLNEGENRAKAIIKNKREDISQEELQRLSEIISIGAIKYGYLKKSRESDSVFDWDEYMSFEGNSGPYIQYAYVRAQKILLSVAEKDTDNHRLIYENSEEKNLIAHILNFPLVIENLTTSYYPHILCTYVYELTKLFSSFYANIQILSETDQELKHSRLILLQTFCFVIEESFEILGISLPEKM